MDVYIGTCFIIIHLAILGIGLLYGRYEENAENERLKIERW